MSSNNNREMHKLPLLPLRGVVIFPGSVTTLDVGREKSLAAVEEAVKGDRRIFVVAQRNSMVDAPDIGDLYSVGTIVTIRQIMPLPDQTVRLMVQGELRAILVSVRERGAYQEAEIAAQDVNLAQEVATAESRAYMRTIVSFASQLIK